MEIYQLRTFLFVARQGSITRASESLCLSQPAVSAHIKSLEEELGITLFERTPKGMILTPNGVRLFARADQMLSMHREMLDEARRIKGRLSGQVRIGSARHPSAQVLSRLLTSLADSHPDLEIVLQHGSTQDILQGIRRGSLDGGFVVNAGADSEDLHSTEVQRFGIFLAASPGMVSDARRIDWTELAGLPWLCPISGSCCGMVTERIFQSHGFRPGKLFNVDQENVTRSLIEGGVGVGLLHEESAFEAQRQGKVELLGDGPQHEARLVFSHLASRQGEVLISALASTVVALVQGPAGAAPAVP
ncbi:MAG: LysR family transcriptional regulator [Rubrivivax sp.]|nr:MAG: LysR family transcriptional regulator [Rubrivivax sp.]